MASSSGEHWLNTGRRFAGGVPPLSWAGILGDQNACNRIPVISRLAVWTGMVETELFEQTYRSCGLATFTPSAHRRDDHQVASVVIR
jgi:hypothetical protein